MHCLVISPGEKIGPLELGMTPKQIWNALSCLCAEWGFSISDTHIDETWEKGTGKLCCRYLIKNSFYCMVPSKPGHRNCGRPSAAGTASRTALRYGYFSN